MHIIVLLFNHKGIHPHEFLLGITSLLFSLLFNYIGYKVHVTFSVRSPPTKKISSGPHGSHACKKESSPVI